VRRALAVAAVAGIAVLGATGAASASPGIKPGVHDISAHDSGVIRTGSVSRFNVGATHSPAVERLLAGHAAVAPRAEVRPAGLPAAASTVQGIDVSSRQHPKGAAIDWSAVAAAGYKFAFIKVTEGSYYVNSYYASDAAGAQAAGMLVAPYAFAIPNYSGGALQADYALDNAQYAPDGQMLAPILDIEPDPYDSAPPLGDGTNQCYGLTPAQMVAWIGAFTTEIHRRTGQSPAIYTSSQWWDACTNDSTAFKSDPLWLVAWGTAAPAPPAAWANWTYWQYTSSATLPAVAVPFDASYLSSTALELAAPANQSDRAGGSAGLSVRSLDGGTAAAYSATGLPTGLKIDPSTGVVSGKLPVLAASFPVKITATAGAEQATQSFSWYVHSRIRLAAAGRLTGSVGTPVKFRVRATDGLSGCTLAFSASRLPRGLTISSCGIISGWPTTSGAATAVVTVSGSSGHDSIRWRIAGAGRSGPAGQIRLSRDGKCLAGRRATDIAIETCSRAADERWTIAADGTVRMRSECLAAKSASSTASAALELASCRKGGVRWQVESDAVLTNLGSGRCLADTGTKNGARAAAAVCQATPNNTGSASTPSASQQWTLPAGTLTSGIPGNCASSVGGGPDPAVTLRRCNQSVQQAWTIKPDGAISAAGKCLGTAGGTAPGTKLRLERCVTGAATQVWQLSGGPVGVQLVMPAAGLCLADPGDSSKRGTRLIIGPCVAGDAGTSWRVG
jgi:GH25 family lysozyme M1 (1,4-beta-N-acetylmuramidase)